MSAVRCVRRQRKGSAASDSYRAVTRLKLIFLILAGRREISTIRTAGGALSSAENARRYLRLGLRKWWTPADRSGMSIRTAPFKRTATTYCRSHQPIGCFKGNSIPVLGKYSVGRITSNVVSDLSVPPIGNWPAACFYTAFARVSASI